MTPLLVEVSRQLTQAKHDPALPEVDGLVRLLEKGGLVRKAPLATGARVLGCREEETWEEGILEEVREVRTAEEVDTLTLEEAEQAGGATSPSRGGASPSSCMTGDVVCSRCSRGDLPPRSSWGAQSSNIG